MEYEGIGIGGNIVDKKDVLLFEMNGIDVENYSISEIRKLWCEPNIKLKFKNNKELYCESADMLFIFAHDDKKKNIWSVCTIICRLNIIPAGLTGN